MPEKSPTGNGSSRKTEGLVTPVLRRAILLKISPPPTGRQADALFELLKADWTGVRDHYREVVARSAGIGLKGLDFDNRENVRCRLEGETRVIDFPRLRTRDGAAQAFDTRISMAICTEKDEMSSKVWSRVGLPLTGSAVPPGVSLGKLEDLTAFFRRIAIETAGWGEAFLRRTLRHSFPDLRARRRGCLEVSVLGARDELLVPYFDRLAQTDTTARELLEEKETDARFSQYFRRIAKLPANRLRDATAAEPGSFWFSSPVAVELDGGELGLRQALYYLRPTNDTVQVMGLAYDDSAGGDLAQRSAVKVSRWIANRV